MEVAERAGFVQPEDGKAKWYQMEKEEYTEGDRSPSEVHSKTTRGNDHKVQQEKY